MLPARGPAAIYELNGGKTLAHLPTSSAGASAVSFTPDGMAIEAATRAGAVTRYDCTLCGPFRAVFDAAVRAVKRPLTRAERAAYLDEEWPATCPYDPFRKQPACVDLSPDSGPPGTIVEVESGEFGRDSSVVLVDARDKTWQLYPPEAPDDPFGFMNRPRAIPPVGFDAAAPLQFAIPKRLPLGRATIEISGGSRTAAHRFDVTCLTC